MFAAIDASPLNAFSHLDREHATLAAGVADVSLPFGGVPIGVKELDAGRRLAVHPRLGAVRRPHRHGDVDDGAPHPRPRRRRARRPDDGVGVRRRQPHPHRPPRHDAQPVAARPHAGRLVGRLGGGRRRRAGDAGHRRRRRRLDPHPGRLLRPRRPEGDVRPHPAVPEREVRQPHRGRRLPRRARSATPPAGSTSPTATTRATRSACRASRAGRPALGTLGDQLRGLRVAVVDDWGGAVVSPAMWERARGRRRRAHRRRRRWCASTASTPGCRGWARRGRSRG